MTRDKAKSLPVRTRDLVMLQALASMEHGGSGFAAS